jgi:vacuolar-type H+-ATPase subunit I/STV1
MISFLAKILRGMSYVAGFATPAPGQSERKFVIIWIGMLLGVVVFLVGFLFVIAKLGLL